jgi:hypothetical protein
MLHALLGDHEAAIRSYNAALLLGEDALTRGERGWAHLHMDAAQLALSDFTKALRLGPATSRVLCGRAMARVKLRQEELAVQDAEAALKVPDAAGPEGPLLAACVYARVARLALGSARPDQRGRAPSGGYEGRALDLLVESLRRVSPADREAFWRTRVLKEDALAHVRGHPRVARLVRPFAR